MSMPAVRVAVSSTPTISALALLVEMTLLTGALFKKAMYVAFAFRLRV